MEVNIDELQKIVSILFANIKENKGNTISIDLDYYWNIDFEEKYNPYKDPTSYSMGQLSFDLESLKEVLSKREPMFYDFIWLSEIIKIIGVENSAIKSEIQKAINTK